MLETRFAMSFSNACVFQSNLPPFHTQSLTRVVVVVAHVTLRLLHLSNHTHASLPTGLLAVRGAEVVEVRDEEGGLMNDFTGRVRFEDRKPPKGECVGVSE